MVRLRLVEAGDMPTYDYFPESFSEEPGRIAVDAKTRERISISQAPSDPTDAYKFHAWRRIEQMLDAGELLSETYAAWY